MSRHPSPGPSIHAHAPPSSSTTQVFHQIPPPASAPLRQKSKAYATGIAAGAEDVKYQAKYKELKRKVKEIEADNDKLQYKVLHAKRSIQRMKLEQGVLYERLSAVPPSPDIQDRHTLPPIHAGPGIPPTHQPQAAPHPQHPHAHPHPHSHTLTPSHPHSQSLPQHGNNNNNNNNNSLHNSHHSHNHHPQQPPPQHQQQQQQQHRDPREYPYHPYPPPTSSLEGHAFMDLIRTSHGPVRIIPGPDGRPIPVPQDAPVGPGITPSPHVHHPPRSANTATATAGAAGAGAGAGAATHDSSLQLPPLPPLSIVQHFEPPPRVYPHEHEYEHNRSHPATALTGIPVLVSGPGSKRYRGKEPVYLSSYAAAQHQQQIQRSQQQQQQQQYASDTLQYDNSLAAPAAGNRERSRRHDIHDLAGSGSNNPPSGSGAGGGSAHVDHGNSSRLHTHQRVGPGTYIGGGGRNEDHHDREWERERERDRDRDRDRERERERGREYGASRILTPPVGPRERRGEYQDHPGGAAVRLREEQGGGGGGYYHDGPANHYAMVSRSGTPGSGTGSGSGHVGGGGEGPSRADSLGQGQGQGQGQGHGGRFALRPVSQPQEEMGEEEEGRSASQTHVPIGGGVGSGSHGGVGGNGGGAGGSAGLGGFGDGGSLDVSVKRPCLERRKRSRSESEHNDQEDHDHDVAGDKMAGNGGGGYPGVQDDGNHRGGKRFHASETDPDEGVNAEQQQSDKDM